MNEQTRNIPVPDPNAERMKYIFPSASLGDMTGRIPFSVDPEQIQQAYGEIYPYLAGEQGVQNGLDE